MKKTLLSLSLFAFFLTGCTQTTQNIPTNLTLFYSATCPHCKNVEKFMSDNNVESKLTVDQKEIGNGKTENMPIFATIIKACNIDKNQAGVPLLWTGKECLTGDEAIIQFFQLELQKK